MVIYECESSSQILTDELFEITPKKLVETFNFALKEPPSSVQNCSDSALNDELKSKVFMKTGIAHAKGMQDLSPILNTFSATTISRVKTRKL